MTSGFSKVIASVLVPLLGCVVCHPVLAQDLLPGESIEILDTIEVPATYDVQEEREINIPQPDTSTFIPLESLMVATIPKTLFVSETKPKIVRDSIADRKGLWKTVRSIVLATRPIILSEPDLTTFVPFNGLMVATISKTLFVSEAKPKIVRDSIADRKRLLRTVRLIRSDRPQYPQIARKEGWEGTVVLRLTIDSEGGVEKVTTQKSSGFSTLDESAMESVKAWRFDPAKDGEFPISSAVDLPIRFDLEEYGNP